MSRFEKRLEQKPSTDLVEEMKKKGYKPAGIELLKTDYSTRNEEQIKKSIENFYLENGSYVDVELIDAEDNIVFVFVKNKETKQ